MKKFFVGVAMVFSVLGHGYSVFAQGVEAPIFVVGDTWTFQAGSSVFTETVTRTDGTSAFVNRVTVSSVGEKTELPLVYNQGIRQGPGNFHNLLQFPIEVGKEWQGKWTTTNYAGTFKTKVVKQDMVQVAGGSYMGYWHRYISYEDTGGSLRLEYVYVPDLKRVVEQVRNQHADAIKLRRFSVKNSAGLIEKGTDPAFSQ